MERLEVLREADAFTPWKNAAAALFDPFAEQQGLGNDQQAVRV